MSRAKPSRTILPAGSIVLVVEDGFELHHAADVISRRRWGEVRQIAAYTRIHEGAARLCLDFAFSRSADRIVIDESVDGWTTFIAAMHQAFPAADAGWREKARLDDEARDAALLTAAVVPSFTANPVLVWPAP